MSRLEVRGLSHRFSDGSFGLREVSFAVEAGELLLLAGRNGSGKTILMKHLNGLLTPTSGEVLLDGKPIGDDLRSARQLIGLVFQDPDNQIVGQSVYDDVAFGPENLRLPPQEVDRRVNSALERLGLTDLATASPRRLSGGEKRRLAIADVLAMEAQIIIMDEPFSGLDFPGVRQLQEEIHKLHRAGHTIIVISHDVDTIIAHATRMVIMERGGIVADGRPQALLSQLESHGIRPPLTVGEAEC